MQEIQSRNNSLTKGFAWKLLERFGVQGVQFVLQMVLARLLDPEHYGVLSLMVIFTTLANVFIQNGFNSSLIQNKDVTEEDYSSVLWITLGTAGIIYVLFYFAAPLIAEFYEMPDIIKPFRVLALMLFPGAINSIQLAKASREMDFRKVFTGSLAGIIVAGIIGISMAYAGAGLWALVAQSTLNICVACIVMGFTVKWRPRLVCNFTRVRVLFSFGWKLLVSSMLDTLYQDISALVIGKKYDSSTLAYYNRGKQFPQVIISAFGGAMQTVMLSAMSAKQDDQNQVKQLTKTSLLLSSYIIVPLMIGLIGVAEPMVRFFLTDKWLPCVQFLQISCLEFALFPIHSCNLQAINSVGRSDIFLKLEIVKKIIGTAALIVAIVYFKSPIAIAVSCLFNTIMGCFVNAYPNKKLIGYSGWEQLKDILPSFAAALLMLPGVLAVQMLGMSDFVTLILQVIVGVGIYVAFSAIFRLEPFRILLNMVKGILHKAK